MKSAMAMRNGISNKWFRRDKLDLQLSSATTGCASMKGALGSVLKMDPNDTDPCRSISFKSKMLKGGGRQVNVDVNLMILNSFTITGNKARLMSEIVSNTISSSRYTLGDGDGQA
jgi:hypothetical protein